MTRPADLHGMVFGRLTCVSRAENSDAGKARWLCECSCGKQTIALAASMMSGRQVSCGCHRAELVGDRNRTHGMSNTPLYERWQNMLRRCHSPSATYYSRYGGRGISVCKRWRKSFRAFADDMGEPPFADAELDRLDNNKGYSKANCRWSTRIEQCNNRSSNILVEHDGRTMTLAKWQRELGFDYEQVRRRIRDCGWDFARAIAAP